MPVFIPLHFVLYTLCFSLNLLSVHVVGLCRIVFLSHVHQHKITSREMYCHIVSIHLRKKIKGWGHIWENSLYIFCFCSSSFVAVAVQTVKTVSQHTPGCDKKSYSVWAFEHSLQSIAPPVVWHCNNTPKQNEVTATPIFRLQKCEMAQLVVMWWAVDSATLAVLSFISF